MGYYQDSTRFLCKCGRWSTTIKKDITLCQKCRIKEDHSRCEGCGKKFYSKTGKSKCRACNALSNNYSSTYLKVKTRKLINNNCSDHTKYEVDIRLLYVKMKNNLLSYIDLFRIASIYMEITCNEMKYSSLEPEEQCKSMLNDMIKMVVSGDYREQKVQHGRGVVRIDDDGEVIEEYKSIKHAAEVNGVYKQYITHSCNSSSDTRYKNRRLRFRWKNLI